MSKVLCLSLLSLAVLLIGGCGLPSKLGNGVNGLAHPSPSSEPLITIENRAGHSIEVELAGPVQMTLTVPPGGSARKLLPVGYYTMIVSASGLKSAIGKRRFSSRGRYRLAFGVLSRTVLPDPDGHLVIEGTDDLASLKNPPYLQPQSVPRPTGLDGSGATALW